MRDLSECQTYVMHMRLEHRHINEAVHDVVSLFSTETAANSKELVEQLAQKLRVLRAELAKHFAEEDAGGCIEEAISHCPSVSQAATTLEGQHSLLLAHLDRLIEQTRKRTTDEDPSQLQVNINDFAKQLNAHESLENQIMQDAFGTGVDETNSCS